MAVPKGETKSRRALYVENEEPLPLPDHADLGALIDVFFEIGPTLGDGPITWQEIDAYSRLTGADFLPWEAHTLSEMSRAFRDELSTATDPLSIEPLERNYGQLC